MMFSSEDCGRCTQSVCVCKLHREGALYYCRQALPSIIYIRGHTPW
jgi:hypothetical protein